MRYNSNYVGINELVLKRLIKKILNGITSMLVNYSFLYSEDELKNIINLRNMLDNCNNIEIVSKIENELKSYSFKTWEYEKNNGNSFIHWLKKDKLNTKSPIISTTFGGYNFCDSAIGIKYDVNISAFISACEKDAATIIESSNKKSIYTIMDLENGFVVNSYNLATPIITPKQLFDYEDNSYMSKHNEIILDAKYAIPIEIICLNDNCINMAKRISEEYNIPFNMKINSTKKHS